MLKLKPPLHLAHLDLNDPEIRLRGSNLITKRGKWDAPQTISYEQAQGLILRAIARHGANIEALRKPFTDFYGRTFFWYNSKLTGSSHAERN